MYTAGSWMAEQGAMTHSLFVKRLYWISFAARFSIGLSGWLATRFMDIPLLQDALYYEKLAVEVANDWLNAQSSQWLEASMARGHNPWVMVMFLAITYYAAGGAQITPLAICVSCLITAFAPVLTYKISIRLGAPLKGARLAGWLVALSPAFAFWSGALYKEGVILVVLNLAIYHMLILQQSFQPRSLLVVLLSAAALFGLRFYLAIILGVVFALGFLLGRSRTGSGFATANTMVRQIVLLTGFVLAVIGLGLTDRAREYLPEDLEKGFDKIQNSRMDLAGAKSGFLRDAEVSTPEKAVQFLPVGLLYFLTVPWPGSSGSVREVMAMPETLAWVLMYPVVLMGMKAGLRRNFQGSLLLILTSLAICCFYAIWVANTGAAFRLRIQVWILWAVFIGWGWAECQARRNPGRQVRTSALRQRSPSLVRQ
jgi:hypothetical protein